MARIQRFSHEKCQILMFCEKMAYFYIIAMKMPHQQKMSASGGWHNMWTSPLLQISICQYLRLQSNLASVGLLRFRWKQMIKTLLGVKLNWSQIKSKFYRFCLNNFNFLITTILSPESLCGIFVKKVFEYLDIVFIV